MSVSEPSANDLDTYRMTLSYDGREFFGWQRHGEKPTIQLALERAITQTLGVRVPVRGSGRTDRGTHARGQVASVRLPRGTDPAEARNALNDALPPEIRIYDLQLAQGTFDACDSAVAKQYRYVIWNTKQLPAEQQGRVWHIPGPLKFQAMRDACPTFIGEHDFASFATRPNFKQKSTRRTVTLATLEKDGPQIVFEIRADGFLYKMVRNIVRALVKVGEGRYSTEDLRRILAARDRKAAPGTAPASGLYLDTVFYPDD